MKINFVYEVDSKIQPFSERVKRLTRHAESKAAEQIDLCAQELIGVKLIIQEDVKGFEEFIKPRKPRFRKKFIMRHPIDGDSEINGYGSIEHLFSQETYLLLQGEETDELHTAIQRELLVVADIIDKKNSSQKMRAFFESLLQD